MQFFNWFKSLAGNKTIPVPVVTSLSGVTGEPGGIIILQQGEERALYSFDDNGLPKLSGGGSGSSVAMNVTVGAGGDFSTINEAVRTLSRLRKNYMPGGLVDTITLLDGFVIQEQILAGNVDLSHIRIVAQNSLVTVSLAALTVQMPGVSGVFPLFGGNNAKMPTIAFNMNFDSSGTTTGRWAVYLLNSAELSFESNRTLTNAPSLFYFASGSTLRAQGGTFTGSKGTILLADACATGILFNCNFSDGIGTGSVFRVEAGSRVRNRNCTMNNIAGRIRVINNATCDCSNLSMTGNTASGTTTLISVEECGDLNLTSAVITGYVATGSVVRALRGGRIAVNSGDVKQSGSPRELDLVVQAGGFITASTDTGGSSQTPNIPTPSGLILKGIPE